MLYNSKNIPKLLISIVSHSQKKFEQLWRAIVRCNNAIRCLYLTNSGESLKNMWDEGPIKPHNGIHMRNCDLKGEN